MFVSRVSATSLSSQRLDADFYRPEFLENEAKLLTKKVAKLGDVGHFFAGPFGSLLPSNLYLDEGVPLFRVGNVGQFEVLTDNFAHLAPLVHNELKTSEVRPGDLLVVKASVGEKICKVPDWIPKANITQHIIGIRPNGTFDTDYVSAFLFSSFGVLQLQRYSLGSIIQYLGITDAKGTYIVKADSVAQKYIGDKVRQAERLRAWAKASIANADELIAEKFKHQLANSMTKHPRRLPTKLLSTISLGPEFARATEGQDTFIDSSPLAKFTEYCKCGDPIRSEDRVTGIYPYYGASGPIDVHDEFNFEGEFLVVAQDGSIGCANVARGKIWANNHVWVIKIKPEYDLDAICRFLSQHFPYWKGVTTGSVVPKVTSENLLRVKVSDSIASDIEVGDYLRSANSSVNTSFSLTNAAKILVEALIEGQLTEAELIAAEQALQTGNDQPDRLILNRLKTDGVDGNGQPLFTDLDQLYSLLEQAGEQ